MTLEDRFSTKKVFLTFMMEDIDFILFRNICRWVGAKEWSYEKLEYRYIIIHDLMRHPNNDFKEIISQIYEYIDVWKPGINKKLFDAKLLVSLYFYIEKGISVSRCMDILFTDMNFGITTIEIVPKRIPEECSYEYRIKLEVLDYYNELFNEMLWNCKKRVEKGRVDD